MKGARWAAPGTETLYSLWSSFAAHWSQWQASNWPVFWLLGQAFTGPAAAVQTPSHSLPSAPLRESSGPSTGASSAWKPAWKLLNGNESSPSWWLAFLFPKRQCSEPGQNGVFAASDTSGVCSPPLPLSGTGAAVRRQQGERKNRQHLVSPWGEPCSAAAQDSWSLLSFGIILVSQTSQKLFSVSVPKGFFCIFAAKNWNRARVGKSKRQNVSMTNSHPSLQLRHFWGGREWVVEKLLY